eukprot:6543377-Pyramimonas_sp.AAC.1
MPAPSASQAVRPIPAAAHGYSPCRVARQGGPRSPTWKNASGEAQRGRRMGRRSKHLAGASERIHGRRGGPWGQRQARSPPRRGTAPRRLSAPPQGTASARGAASRKGKRSPGGNPRRQRGRTTGDSAGRRDNLKSARQTAGTMPLNPLGSSILTSAGAPDARWLQ